MKETIDRKSLKDYKGSRHGNFLKSLETTALDTDFLLPVIALVWSKRSGHTAPH